MVKINNKKRVSARKAPLGALLAARLAKVDIRKAPGLIKRKTQKQPKRLRGNNQLSLVSREKAPVAIGTTRTTRMPRHVTVPITHRESLGTIVSTSTAFTVLKSLPVNPGQSASYPWLSQIAQQYETYKPVRVRYIYEPRCSSATAGTVCMVMNYDAAEPDFSSLVQAENYGGATVGNAWRACVFNMDNKETKDYNLHYVRPNSQPSGTDIKTYDLGNFQFIVSGVSAGEIGELYVEYTYQFQKPRTPNPLGSNLVAAHIRSGLGAATAAAPLTGAVLMPGGTFTPTFTAAGVITIPSVGRYIANVLVWSSAISAPPNIAAGTATIAPLVNNDNYNQAYGFVLNTTGSVTSLFDVTAPNQTLVMDLSTTGMTAGNVDVFITQVSSGLTKTEGDEKKMSQSNFDALFERFMQNRLEQKGSKYPQALGQDEKSAYVQGGRLVRAPDDDYEDFVNVSALAAQPLKLRIESSSATPKQVRSKTPL